MSRNNLIGRVLGGRYRIDEILGQGGMSAVYKAYDPNLKRVVAVKTIHAHLADAAEFVNRFEEEATAVAQLRHANIVQVYDFDHDQGLYYMVQEFLPGETLQERLRRLNRVGKRLPLVEAVEFARNICDAVGYAHQRGMIHRDFDGFWYRQDCRWGGAHRHRRSDRYGQVHATGDGPGRDPRSPV